MEQNKKSLTIVRFHYRYLHSTEHLHAISSVGCLALRWSKVLHAVVWTWHIWDKAFCHVHAERQRWNSRPMQSHHIWCEPALKRTWWCLPSTKNSILIRINSFENGYGIWKMKRVKYCILHINTKIPHIAQSTFPMLPSHPFFMWIKTLIDSMKAGKGLPSDDILIVLWRLLLIWNRQVF